MKVGRWGSGEEENESGYVFCRCLRCIVEEVGLGRDRGNGNAIGRGMRRRVYWNG